MKWIFHVLALCLLAGACTKTDKHLPDGIYLLATENSAAYGAARSIKVDRDFMEPGDSPEIKILTDDYVPLVLAEKAKLVSDSLKKHRLFVTLNAPAADKLRNFTGANHLRKVVLVVNGCALTVHKIKETITDGKLQITRCSDDSCPKLEKALEDNVK